MSTHSSIGFYEDLTKIIFKLLSDIIKNAPYFFCCLLSSPYVDPDLYDGKVENWVLSNIYTGIRNEPRH